MGISDRRSMLSILFVWILYLFTLFLVDKLILATHSLTQIYPTSGHFCIISFFHDKKAQSKLPSLFNWTCFDTSLVVIHVRGPQPIPHHTCPAPTDSATGPNRSLSVENGEEGELEMELPPPMKVLEQPMSAAAAQGSQGTAAATAGPPMPPLDNILTDVPSRVSLVALVVVLCCCRDGFIASL